MKLPREVATIIAVTALLSLLAPREAAAATVTLRLAHVANLNQGQGVVSEAFLKEVARLTNGEVRIAHFHSGQLGGERDIFEGVRLGTIDLMSAGMTVAGAQYPPIELLGLPYLYTGEEHYRRVISGPLGKKLLDGFEAIGIKGLGLHSGGFRSVVNNVRPVRALSDLKGLKLRLREVEVEIDTFKAFGANPVPIPYPELYTSLQTGIVDGYEHVPVFVWTGKLFEVSKYISLTNHVQNAMGMIINLKKFQSLSPQHQKALTQASEHAMRAGNELIDKTQDDARRELEKRGIIFNTVPDLKPFKEAAKPVYDRFLKKQPPWVADLVRDTEAAAK